MHKPFSKTLETISSHASEKLAGYDEDELSQLERLYDIEVKGDLKKFLKLAGRDSGGMIVGDSMINYSEVKTVRSHFLFQLESRKELFRLGRGEMLRAKPFFFATEAENLYYFLLTKEEGKQIVYFFDEDTDLVGKTDWTFADYVEEQIAAASKDKSGITYQGEMLKI